jgi:hypothetical protein
MEPIIRKISRKTKEDDRQWLYRKCLYSKQNDVQFFLRQTVKNPLIMKLYQDKIIVKEEREKLMTSMTLLRIDNFYCEEKTEIYEFIKKRFHLLKKNKVGHSELDFKSRKLLESTTFFQDVILSPVLQLFEGLRIETIKVNHYEGPFGNKFAHQDGQAVVSNVNRGYRPKKSDQRPTPTGYHKETNITIALRGVVGAQCFKYASNPKWFFIYYMTNFPK